MSEKPPYMPTGIGMGMMSDDETKVGVLIGELFPAFGPTDQQSEDWAIRIAKGLAPNHIGVIAWSREADPALGDYWPPTTLFAATFRIWNDQTSKGPPAPRLLPSYIAGIAPKLP